MDEAIPVVDEVDLLIVGGAAGAASCALAAAEAGLRVRLVAPRPYLGDDIGAPFRFWPEADEDLSDPLAATIWGDGRPPSPMRVKLACEQALVAAEVPFLLNCHAAGILRDADARIAGAVIADRAGRQAIRARHVVDATATGLLLRQAGHPFTPFPDGELEVAHVTIGGPAVDAPGVEVEALPSFVCAGDDGEIELAAHRYRLRLDLGGGDWEALCRARADAVERCAHNEVYQHAERLDLLSPDRIADDERATAWTGSAGFPLAALAIEPGLHCLGPCAPIARAAAAGLRRPGDLMAVGRRLGAAIAGEPAGTTGDDIRASIADAAAIDDGHIRVDLGGLRPFERGDAHVPATADALPKLGSFDVVVIGGGTGGAPAGIAAGRAGARTLVCENLAVLGGVGTAGQIANYYFGNRVGFTAEVDEGVRAREPRPLAKEGRWTPAAKAAWLHRAACDAGTALAFGTICCGAWVVDGRVRGVVVAGPMGYGLVEAGAVVDATGGADVAAAAGAPCVTLGADHVAVQGTGLAGVSPVKRYHNSDHSFSDDTDVVDATQFLVTSKVKFRDFFDAGQLVDSRERRQIDGEVSLSPVDFLCARTFPDSISLSSSNFDSHGFTIHPLFLIKPPNKDRLWVYVPFRALLPKAIDGVLVTGLGLSAHRDALPVVRMQPDVQNHGYAAGRAAAMAAEAGCGLREIDLRVLQEHLVATGILPAEALEHEDSFPVSDERLRRAVEEGWNEHEGIALVFAHPERALPLLRAAHDAATDSKPRVRYAQMLGLLGDPHGVETLAEEVASRHWDPGWNYKGMGQFGASMSELDGLIVALGWTGDARAWDAIVAQMDQLGGDADFSHFRALVLACERLHPRHPHPGIAERLARYLAHPSVGDHVIATMREAHAALTDDPCENRVRNQALKQIVLARGVYRCGDHEGLGAETLRRFCDDLRGHFARHARAVLAEGAGSPRAPAAAEAEAASS